MSEPSRSADGPSPAPNRSDAYWEPTGPHRPPHQPPSGGVPPVPDGRPDFALPADHPVSFPAPAGVDSVQPREVYSTAQFTAYGEGRDPGPVGRRGVRAPAVVAIAALTALVVGGLAGFGGTYVADLVPRTTAPSEPAAPTGTTTPGTSTPGTDPTGRSTVAPAPDTADTVAIAKKVLPSTVKIQVRSGDRGGTGSGFVIDAGLGYVLTNNHVVELGARSGARISVQLNDQTITPARIVGRSPSYDIAVIQIQPKQPLTAVEVGDASASEVGQTVIAVGAPLGLGGTVTQGIISAKNRPVAVGADGSDPDANVAYIDALQTDAPINPGNSGGPLVDAGGRVIGVNSAILTLGSGSGTSGNIGLGFAIPINQAEQIADELIDDGVATYPVLGAEMDDVSRGVQVTAVNSRGPAAKAGLKGDDVIMSIDGEPVSSAVQLTVQIRTHRPGDVIALEYVRNGTTARARVTLGSKEG